LVGRALARHVSPSAARTLAMVLATLGAVAAIIRGVIELA
jgi:Na+/glutamate symporter